MDHSYEEIRSAMIEILAGREQNGYQPRQFANLMSGVAEALQRREAPGSRDRHSRPQLTIGERESFREAFWDLFLQGVITLGMNDANREFPYFKVTQFGNRVLENENTYFFHDVSTYTALVKSNVPNINSTTLLYLQEAMQAFKSGCMLSATVMLGVAAEHSFLLLLESAQASTTYGSKFSNAAKQRTMLQKFRKFKAALDQHVVADLPSEIKEDLDIDFAGILSVIRTFRNESGHPTGKVLEREQTYVLLQMFVPYCKKIYQLIGFFR